MLLAKSRITLNTTKPFLSANIKTFHDDMRQQLVKTQKPVTNYDNYKK